jgi:NADH-quinone oxidoreductase subunit L
MIEPIIVFGPLIAALVAGLFQRLVGDRVAMSVTTSVLFVSAGLSWVLFLRFFGAPEAYVIELLRYIDVAGFTAHWSIRVDALSVTMMVVITSVSALVHLYSWGYMAQDPHRARFFSYLSFFTFAMLMLVTAADFMQLFFGWEGVGLASYLLIGFWYQKASANDAAIKAFVVNRVGDFGFALGIMAVFLLFGSIEFKDVFAAAPAKVDAVFAIAGYEIRALEAIGLLLFVGAMGKSAQFFLHTWLPDAMEGPTPVSALIHAATMVTAGVYLVCLCSPIYENAPIARDVITILGAVTAFFAATIGLAQNDIKRVVAYSTCSQLGFMFFAAGIGAYEAAMFHLFTHAFFKALLFLGAGSVIHGMHHEQDMRRMGALAGRMKFTWIMMLLGTLAITGVGLPGTHFGSAGFVSKDAILESAYAAQQMTNAATLAFWLGLTAALLTSFYSWRLMFMTFQGRPMWADAGQQETHNGGAHEPGHAHAHDHHAAGVNAGAHHMQAEHAQAEHAQDGHAHEPHESPVVMLVPLAVLALGAVAAGFIFFNLFVEKDGAAFWKTAIFHGAHNHVLHERHYVPLWVKWAPFGASILGFVLAVWFYLLNQGMGARIAANKGPLHTFLSNKWFFDELYHFVFVRGAKALGDLFWKIGDQRLIDGLGPNGMAVVARACARRLVRLQTGYVYHYAFLMLIAAVAFGGFVLAGSFGGAP